MNPIASSPSDLLLRSARAVLADDERLMRDQLRARLAEVWPALVIVAEARNGLEAVEAVREHRPDIAFLDIRMPGMTGVEAAREIVQLDLGEDVDPPEIVFITAYDQYALEAFEQGVSDYVLKPAERDRLRVTADRLCRRLAARASQSDGAGLELSAGRVDAPEASMQQLLHRLAAHLGQSGQMGQAGHSGRTPYLQWIQATVGSVIQMVAVSDVLFFMSDEKYTRVQTPQLEALIRKPIKELVDELDPERFWQIHRSSLVAVDAIAAVGRDYRGRQIVSIKGHPQKLEVSRSYAHLFKGM